MDHVVYTQVYLEDISKYGEMNQVFAEIFSKTKTPPARAVLGVAKLPEPSIQISAVAVRNLARCGRCTRRATSREEASSRQVSLPLTGCLFRACPAAILQVGKFRTIRRPR